MSDTATIDAAPAAPTAPVAPATPAAPATAPQASEATATAAAPAQNVHGKSAREFVKDVKRGNAAPTPAVHHSAAQPRDVEGQFANAAPVAPAATPAPANTPAAPAPQASIRIPIPEGHALREMGIDALTASTPTEERAIRGLLNSHVRRNEVDTERTQRQAAERRAEIASAEAKEWQQRAFQTFASPDQIATYQELIAANRPEDAEVYMEGIRSKQSAQVKSKLGEIEKQHTDQATAETNRQNGVQFMESALTEARTRYGPHTPEFINSNEFASLFMNALTAFTQSAGRYGRQPTMQDFFKDHLDTAWATHGDVRTVFTRRDADAAARREEETMQKARAEAEKTVNAAVARAQNPLGRIPAGSDVGRASTTPATSSSRDYLRGLTRRR